jgi:SAM-dependent methyltransferase
MSREIEDRRSRLSPEKRALLERRLRGLSVEAETVPPPAAPAETEELPDLKPILFGGPAGVAPISGQLWQRLVAAGHRAAGELAELPELVADAARETSLDTQAAAIVAFGLAGLGLFQRAGEAHTVDGLIRDHGVLAKHKKVLHRWLATLAEEGMLERQGDSFVARAPIPSPEIAAVVALEHRAYYAENLAKVLDGRTHPLEFYLPGGSSESVESSYRELPIFVYCNGIASAVLAEQAAALPADRRLRLIEVGAGTGGTTSSLLPLLPADRSLFLFTDVSKFFTDLGRRKYADLGFVAARELDLEREPDEQGYPAGGFDWLIAAHVLHATRRVEDTLRRVRRLLAPGGVLLLLEEVRFQRKYHFSMGFLPGFDSFEDADLRPLHPLLPAAGWGGALAASGFADFATFTSEGSAAWTLGVDVMIARADLSDSDSFRP